MLGYWTINVIFIIIIIINLFQFSLKINAQQKGTITNYHQQPENKKKSIKKTYQNYTAQKNLFHEFC